ncbi:hypothetical protein J4Q44_G00167900 [Coregonus suidteri]|uniref:Uncharacterized protein n=1 Tax=Coregonus suidteri TaxID=861788 RepID=A0AAN8QWI8_9TELE
MCPGSLTSVTDPEELNSYLSRNVSSILSITAGVLQLLPQRPGLRRSVVNISSPFALQDCLPGCCTVQGRLPER